MLSYILRIMQEFERTHGRHPQVIYLNPRHMRQLMHECPDLFSVRRPVPLGFRIVVLPEGEISHPAAAWLPARSGAAPGSRRRKRAPMRAARRAARKKR